MIHIHTKMIVFSYQNLCSRSGTMFQVYVHRPWTWLTAIIIIINSSSGKEVDTKFKMWRAGRHAAGKFSDRNWPTSMDLLPELWLWGTVGQPPYAHPICVRTYIGFSNLGWTRSNYSLSIGDFTPCTIIMLILIRHPKAFILLLNYPIIS